MVRYVHFWSLLAFINFYLNKVFNKFGMNKQLIERVFYFITLIFNLIFIIHLLACFWILVGFSTSGSWMYQKQMFADEDSKGSNKPDFDYQDIGAVYIRGVYFIICTLTTVGYGDFKGFTNGEYMY